MSEKVGLALLPGLLLDGALWRAQVESLSDISDPWIADFTTQDSVTEMARSVLAAMPERFALAGLSMGGYVALEIMRQAPERVTRLALLDTKARPDEPEIVERDLMKLATIGEFKGVTPRLLPMLIHHDRLGEAALTGEIMAMAERIGRDAFLRQQQAILTRPDSRPTLARITCPTLVLCGRQDQLTPVEHHTEMAAGIANARLVVVDACGHLPPMEQPERCSNELRRWFTAE